MELYDMCLYVSPLIYSQTRGTVIQNPKVTI